MDVGCASCQAQLAIAQCEPEGERDALVAAAQPVFAGKGGACGCRDGLEIGS